MVPDPALTVWLLGAAEIAKSGVAVALTTRVMLALCVSVPLVPVIVTVYDPGGVVEAVVTLNVDDPEETCAGLKEAVAPAGSPVAVKATDPLNPFNGETAAVYVVPLP